MTSPDEQANEIRRARLAKRLLHTCEGGLVEAFQGNGGCLKGFSARLDPADVLITLRIDYEGKAMVAFVGGSTLASALDKARREVRANKLSLRADKWAR